MAQGPKPQSSTPKTGYGLEVAKGVSTHQEFPADFIQRVFVLWFDAGKPSADELWPVIKEESPKMCPSVRVLTRWIVDDFIKKALELDDKIERKIDDTLIERKLDMLNRQAELGRKMQETAWQYIEENDVGSTKNAIALLKLGLETERAAMSVPGFLKGIVGKSEAELLDELKDMLTGDPDIIDLIPADDDEQT